MKKYRIVMSIGAQDDTFDNNPLFRVSSPEMPLENAETLFSLGVEAVRDYEKSVLRKAYSRPRDAKGHFLKSAPNDRTTV